MERSHPFNDTWTSSNQTLEPFADVTTSQLISDELFRIFKIVNFVVLSQFFSLFGVVSNILNVIVFVKIGFSDTINISLLGLAVSDFGSCLTLIWENILMNPWFEALDLPFYTGELAYLSAVWPHLMFTRVTVLITAFITFERCLCVTIPLKVKTLITRKRVKIFIISTYVFVLVSLTPIYYSKRYAWKFDVLQNKSLIRLVFTDEREAIERFFYPFLNTFFSVVAFIVISVCTTILVVSLKRQTKWRRTKMELKRDDVSSKEKKVAQMVVIIATIFVFCFIPTAVSSVVMMFEKSMSIDGNNVKLLISYASFHFILEAVNSACNIFIYYYNSSVYQAMFNQIFKCTVGEQNNQTK